jgi:hypothetical protein
MNLLCKFRGMLVLMEAKHNPEGGRCPDCGGTTFREHAGWTECYECDFAVLTSHIEKASK